VSEVRTVADAIRQAEGLPSVAEIALAADQRQASAQQPPRRYANLMLDIESMSLHPGRALILSLGALPFDLKPGGPEIGPPLLLVFDVAEQLVEGRVVDRGTQAFWGRQPRTASAHFVDPLFEGEAQIVAVRCSLHDLHRRLSNFLADHCAPGFEVYSQGIAFDVANLAAAIVDDGHEPPWRYDHVVDCRTLRRKLPKRRDALPFTLPAAAHDPVHDCIKQIHALWQVATDDMLGVAPKGAAEDARAA
jgi:hypothetical protein